MYQLRLIQGDICKQMLNFRYIILFFALFIFSCDEEELTFDNPLDVENNLDFIPPLTFLIDELNKQNQLEKFNSSIEFVDSFKKDFTSAKYVQCLE